ncbi:hypothetical protein P3T27_007495, partial [Kitasatospora sp. MAA19]|nr:hypothetical protein [Kitasatospora sp. MAA19]
MQRSNPLGGSGRPLLFTVVFIGVNESHDSGLLESQWFSGESKSHPSGQV